MGSKQMILRIVLKLFQFICSVFVVYCLYNTGPHWMLTLICLLVPPFGLYLILRSPDQKSQSTSSEMYRGMLKSKSWLRVEIAICLTMGVAFFGFGILLLWGFLKLADNVYFLLASLGSIVASLLYVFNGLVASGLLQQGAVDIALDTKPPKQMPDTRKNDPNHFSIPMISEQNAWQREETEELRGRPVVPFENTSNSTVDENTLQCRQNVNHPLQPIIRESQQVSRMLACEESSGNGLVLPVDQHPEINQRVIDHIPEELDRSLDNEVDNNPVNNNNDNSDKCSISNNEYVNSSNVALEQRTRYRFAPAKTSSLLNANCSQSIQNQWHASSSNLNSKSKITPIQLMTTAVLAAEVQEHHTDDNRRIEHFNAQFVATGKSRMPRSVLGGRLNEKKRNNKIDAYGASRQDTSRQRRAPYGRYQNFASGADEELEVIGRRRYVKEENGDPRCKGYDRSSDDDSTSGSFASHLTSNENSASLELGNHRPKFLAMNVSIQDIQGGRLDDDDRKLMNETDPSSNNMQQMCAMTPGKHGRRESQRRYHSKQDYRRGSVDVHYPCYTCRESDDEASPSSAEYGSSAIRSRHKTSNSSREHGSTHPSCIPPIVTAIDSSRESEIIRNNSPRRTSSRNKKMRSKGFEVVIRAHSDDERFVARRRARSMSTSPHEKLNDASYFVTEF